MQTTMCDEFEDVTFTDIDSNSSYLPTSASEFYRITIDHCNSTTSSIIGQLTVSACITRYPFEATSNLMASGASEEIQVSVTNTRSSLWSRMTSWMRAAFRTADRSTFMHQKFILFDFRGISFSIYILQFNLDLCCEVTIIRNSVFGVLRFSGIQL